MTSIFHAVLTLFGFGLLIFFHELGHYMAARKCGMLVEEFSLGFGPSLITWRMQGVPWRLRLLPLGGFVRIAGMDLEEARSVQSGAFCNAPLLARATVILAGPVANVLVALALFCALFGLGGRLKPFSAVNPIVGWLSPSSELYELGLRPGDRILAYNGIPISKEDSFNQALFSKAPMRIDAEKIDYATGSTHPLHLQLPPLKSLKPQEVLARSICGAQSLIFQKRSSEQAPLANLDLKAGDRLVWADGQLLFSSQQLVELLSDQRALITLQRGDRRFSVRVKKIYLKDEHTANRPEMNFGDDSKSQCADSLERRFAVWRDLQFDSGLGRQGALYCLPCEVSSDNSVRILLQSGPGSTAGNLAPSAGGASTCQATVEKSAGFLEADLQVGDQILAVDGCPIQDSEDLLKALQKKRVALIFARGENPLISNSSADLAKMQQTFEEPLKSTELLRLAACVGEGRAVKSGNFCLFPPVELCSRSEADPKGFARICELAQSQKGGVDEKVLKTIAEQLVLGARFRDLFVRVNPNPLQLMRQATVEPLKLLKGLLGGSMSSAVISGPIGVAKVIYQTWSESLSHVLFLMGSISLNLAIFNLLPIPVLDGGHLLFLLLEKVRGVPLKAENARRVTFAFFLLLGTLSLLITCRDLQRLFGI